MVERNPDDISKAKDLHFPTSQILNNAQKLFSLPIDYGSVEVHEDSHIKNRHYMYLFTLIILRSDMKKANQ